MSKLLIGESLRYGQADTPTREGEVINYLEEIYNIPTPFVGMRVYCKQTGKAYTITSLASEIIGGEEVFNKVGTFRAEVKDVTWVNVGNVSNMNDFVVAGIYDIKGEHTRIDDNLPFGNTGSGHTFHARLEVLDSSIAPGGQSDDICITQKLTLSNRVAGDGDVYIRTGRGTSKEAITWETWGMLQQNIEVGSVPTLDNLVDNGIYSGVWVNGHLNNYPLTFVCIVINDYFIGTSPRRISQFLYGLSKFDGSTLYQTRVWDDSKDKWSDWEILNKNEISSMIKSSVDNAIKGVIADAPEAFDTLKEIADWIANDKTGAAAMLLNIQQNTAKIDAEVSRAQEVEEEIWDEIGNINERYYEADKNIKAQALGYDKQMTTATDDKVTIKNKTIDGTKEFSFDIGAATIHKAGVMTAEDKEKLDNLTSGGGSGDYNIPLATTKNDGLMSAEDKNKLNTLSPYSNMECASRAAISYNAATKTLTIGTGYMYFYNGKSRQIYFNNTSSYTYTFTGSRVIVFDTVNSAIADKSPEGTLATDIWLLWYDGGGGGLAGGVLYNYVNNSDLTKKIRYNNMEVISRAAVSYNTATKTITIGSGKIFCYNSNTRVEINLTTPYEYTFTGSATIVYNTVDKTIIKRDPTAVNDYDIVLLWYDGTKGLHAGLLYRYVKEEADNAKEQNAPLDKKISAGAVILDNLVVGVPVYIQVRLTGTKCGIGVYNAEGNRKKLLKSIDSGGKSGDVVSVLYVVEEGDAKIKEAGWSSLYLDYVLYLDASSYTTREGVVNQEKYINTQIAASLDTPIKSIIHGGTGSYPQNNLVLYKNAAQKGMLFWECDVRPCADGYVLSHDDDMYQLALDADGNQLTQGDWLCSQKTVAELKTLRTGIKKGVYSIVKGYENATVATLEEFIVLAKVYGACPVIEIKFTATEAQIREIYSIVKRHGMVGRSLFLLYGNRALHGQYLHNIDENTNLIYCGESSIASADLDTIISYKNDKNVVGLNYYISAYTDEVLNKALNAGLLIGTWSATSSSNIVSLVNKGFSMFTIDDMNNNSVTTLRRLI